MLDAVVDDEPTGEVKILFNDGAGVFSGRINYAVGGTPRHILSANVDEDGDLDLIVLNYNDDDFSVLFNNALTGTGVALVTPFNSELHVDHEALTNIVR